MTASVWHVGTCPQCERPNQTVGPLHGEQGGPMFCLRCGMEWHGKHGRKRKLGRVVGKAMRLFSDAGGSKMDIDKLWLAALGLHQLLGERDVFGLDRTIGQDIGDITLELLRDTLRLTHPDHHPPELRELATRVTAELRALEPYLFAAPKPEPKPEPTSSKPQPGRPERAVDPLPPTSKPLYPCERCEGAYSFYYCATCRAELERRRDAGRDRERQKQRAWYRARKERERASRRAWGKNPRCATCNKTFEPRRTDAKYCSPACRQRAHRQRRVTVNTSPAAKLETGITDWPLAGVQS